MPGSAVIGNLAVNLSMETAAFTSGATKAQAELSSLSGGMHSFGSSSSKARIVALELTHVTRSMGEQIAAGVSPVRALTMEMGRLATAAQYAGGPAGLVKMAVGLAAAHPVLLALAGAAAVVTGALAALKSEMNNSGEVQNYIKSLNLTDEQMKKLKDTSVTFGDIMKGVWNTVADHTGADRGIEGFKQFAIGQFKFFLRDSVEIFSNLYGDIVGGYRALIVVWKGFPAALGDVFYSGVNAAIRAINSLLEKSVNGINSFIGASNGILDKFGFSISTITAPHIQEVANQYAGAAKVVGNAFSAETARATAEARSGANAIISETLRNIYDATEQRIKAQVDANNKAAGAHDKAAEAARRHTSALKENADALNADAKMAADLARNLAKIVRPDASVLKTEQLGTHLSPDQLYKEIRTATAWMDSTHKMSQQLSQEVAHISDPLASGIADVIMGVKSLKAAFADMGRSIIAEIIQMTLRMLVFRAISGIFGGNASLGSDITVTGGGSFDVPGMASGGGSFDVPGMASGGSGVFGGFGGVDQNVLSLNGSPIARVSKGEQFSVSNDNAANDRIIVELRDEMLNARIAHGARVQIVQTAPLMQAGVQAKIRDDRRRR